VARLFKHAVALALSKPLNGDFFKHGSTTTTITGLRVTYEVEKHTGKEPNTCRVEIYNLAERTRSELQEKPVHVLLQAGYEDTVETLFQGDLTWADSKKDGADWITTLQLGDGERAFQHARVSRSYRAGVPALTALNEVARAMGLRARPSARVRAQLARQFTGGLVLHGACRSELTRLLAPLGVDWSIQDGELQVLRSDEHRTELPVLVSQDTGMIGSPEFGAPEKKGGRPLLTVNMLLNPRVVAGGRIQVTSRHVNGVFRVERVTHTGDTHGDDWTTTAEARALA
jgi:hypothetical protein